MFRHMHLKLYELSNWVLVMFRWFLFCIYFYSIARCCCVVDTPLQNVVNCVTISRLHFFHFFLFFFISSMNSSHDVSSPNCSNGELMHQSNLSNPHDIYAAKCNPNERFAILLHGWRESCNTTWMKQLIQSNIH